VALPEKHKKKLDLKRATTNDAEGFSFIPDIWEADNCLKKIAYNITTAII